MLGTTVAEAVAKRGNVLFSQSLYSGLGGPRRQGNKSIIEFQISINTKKAIKQVKRM